MHRLSYIALQQKLGDLLHEEHGNCDDNTCAIAKCMENYLYLWAAKLFINTGVASEEFEKTYARLPAIHEVDAEKERIEFLETVESCACPHCNAVVYDPSDSDYYCSNCTNRAVFSVKVNALGPDGVSDVGDRWTQGFNVLEFTERENHCVFVVAMKYGKEPSEFTKTILEESVGVSLPDGAEIEIMAT